MVGEAAPAYPPALGLRRFQRHLLFVKPDVLLVVDDIELAAPQDLELRFHPEQQQSQREGDAFLFAGKSAMLRLEPLTTDDTQVAAAALELQGRHGEERDTMLTVQLNRHTAQWRNAVALSWSGADQQPIHVALEVRDQQWIFHCGSRSVLFDWTTGEAKLRR